MAWKPPVRNFDGVQFERLRKRPELDAKFNEVCDRLSAAYYDGGTFRQGKLWINFGELKKLDPEQAKLIFDKLHGLVWHHYDVALVAANRALGEYPEEEVNCPVEVAQDGTVLKRREDLAKEMAAKWKAGYFELVI